MDIVKTTSVPPWTRSRTQARCFYLYILFVMLLWVVITNWLCIKQWCEMLILKLLCFCYYFIWTWFVITLIALWCMAMYLWTLCNMWHVCWIMYDLGCMLAINRDPSWYSTDYWVYMGSSMIVRLLRRLPLYLCSYKLDSSITAGIRAIFNINCHMCI